MEKINFDTGINTKMERTPLPINIEIEKSSITADVISVIDKEKRYVLENRDRIKNSSGNSSSKNNSFKLSELKEFLSRFGITTSSGMKKADAVDMLINICDRHIQNEENKMQEDETRVSVSIKTKSGTKKSKQNYI